MGILADSPPCALSIAGSDTSGGAGLQADLRTFAELGVYGLSVVTAVTAQTGSEVVAARVLPAGLVGEQLDSVLRSFDPGAIKIGMLGNAENARVVADRLAGLRDRRATTPVVLDPVLAATGGEMLFDPDGVETMLEVLIPAVDLLTPNAIEASLLSGVKITDRESLDRAGQKLVELGVAVLLKGGHLPEGEGVGESLGTESLGTVTDHLFYSGRIERFQRPRLPGRSPHGTGCVLSSAIAGSLARGAGTTESVRLGIEHVVEEIRRAVTFGSDARFLWSSRRG